MVNAGKAIIGQCVEGTQGTHGGTFWPLDENGAATLWIEHRQQLSEDDGGVGGGNLTEEARPGVEVEVA